MSADVQGAAELKARLKAIRTKVAAPAAKAWQQAAVDIARSKVGAMTMPYSKGNLQESIDAKRTATGRISSTRTKAVVVASYHAYFVDAGVKPHSLIARKSRPRSQAGRTIFAKAARKPHPGYPARPFRGKTAAEAYKREPVRDYVIKAWNEAA